MIDKLQPDGSRHLLGALIYKDVTVLKSRNRRNSPLCVENYWDAVLLHGHSKQKSKNAGHPF